MEGQKNRNVKWKQRLCNVHFSEERNMTNN